MPKIVTPGSSQTTTTATTDTKKLTALRTWYAALADRNNNPATALFLGDSITEGQGATILNQRWQSLLATTMRNRFTVNGVTYSEPTYIPAWYASASLASLNPVTLAGSPVKASNYGYGYRYVRLTSGSTTATLSVVADRVDLTWIKGSSGTNLQYTVDGGSATVIDTSGVANDDGQTTTISLGAPAGLHTIVVAWNAGGTANFAGFTVYNGDASKGLRFIDGGHSGFTSGTPAVAAQATALTQQVTTLKPALVYIHYGANDYATNIDPAVYAANIQTIITAVKAGATAASIVTPSIVLVANYQVGGGPYTYAWSQYVQQLQGIANNDSSIVLLDLTQYIPAQSDTSLGLTADGTHFVTKGHQFYADLLSNFISPSVDPVAPRSSLGRPTGALVMPGVDSGGGAIGTVAFGANTVCYEPRYAATPITIDALITEITTLSSVAGAHVRLALYNADANWQPTTLIADAGAIAAGSGDSTGVKTVVLGSPVTVTGRFLVAHNQDQSGGLALRFYRGGNLMGQMNPSLGTSPYTQDLTVAQTYGAFPTNGTVWTAPTFGSLAFRNTVACRVTSI